jgi:uncharacterized protein YprB with RNaseH-like and TPR domain
MKRFGNLAFEIINNQICAAQYAGASSDEIVDCCFFNIENIGLENDGNRVCFHVYNNGNDNKYYLKSRNSDNVTPFITECFNAIITERSKFKITG